MDLGLAGRKALVTGSSRGTGQVIAKTLAREGVHVFVHGLTDSDQSEIASEIRHAGGKAEPVTGDITTDAGADEVVRAVEAAGGIDILVNNFGQASAGRWADSKTVDWLRAYEVNTLSAVRMITAFAPRMRERQWGRIVQISTIGTTRPNARMPEYYAAKGALANLTVSLAKELLGTGVTVNAVSPGLIHTPETEGYLRHLSQKRGFEGTWEEIERFGVRELTGVSRGRMARPEEVADLVAFVVSERAAYLNGANFRVDGGATDCVG